MKHFHTPGIRILSLYTCDAQLEERSDIFSHRFRPTYEATTASIEDMGSDAPKDLETPYRQAVESKTLGIVRFAREYHNLDLDGAILDTWQWNKRSFSSLGTIILY